MIGYLIGKPTELSPARLVLEVNNIGYEIAISLSTYSAIQNKEEVKVCTVLIVREDAQLLYGFFTLEEKSMFNLLISVSGVGPSSAMMMLSTLSVAEIQNAIQSGNAKLLQSVKGIGAKTAQRVIIDLKDKVAQIEVSEKIGFPENKIREEALNALEVLGISKKQAEKQLESILTQSPDSQVEDVIKQVLKNLR